MKILFIGGTRFLGRHAAVAAARASHQLTLFHRGRTPVPNDTQAEVIHGDRDGGLEALSGRRWDAVIDTCGYFPRIVRRSAEFLRDAVDTYLFVSSISVYASFVAINQNEDAPVAEKLEDPSAEVITGETYGPLKVWCERAVQEVFKDRALIVRPGLIVGPDDPTDRFTYWVRRATEAGPILAPGPKEGPVQFIDVRDLGDWMIRLLENKVHGVFNATGPATGNVTFKKLLDTCLEAAGTEGSELHWADEESILKHEIKPWAELPLWLPASEGAGFQRMNVGRAVAAGMRTRPVEDTVVDTLAWDRNRRNADGERPPMQAGLSREKEQEVIRLLRAGQ